MRQLHVQNSGLKVIQYLKRDIRTVQRWEANEGLPIYRQRGSQRGPIHAYKSEIEAWWKARQSKLRQRQPKVAESQKTSRNWLKVSHAQLAILAALIIVLTLSLAKAKQMFLRREPTSSAAVPVHRPTIAVLPFHGSSNTTEDSNLALNITQELIGDCGRTGTLRVIDPRLVMPFEGSTDSPKHIAELLHSDKLLVGTANRSGKRIQVTAQLIEPTTGNAIWSKQFKSNDENLLEGEKKIVSAITTEIEISLGSQPQTGTGNGAEQSLQ